MSRGGARLQSGPAHDPKSARSETRGLTTTAVLPASGYQGRVPGLNQLLPTPNRRHREVWERLWRTPQACMWIKEPWRYPVVADLTRRMVQAEDEESPIGVATIIRQLRDDLGLSYAGLRSFGWEIPVGAASGTAASPTADSGAKPDELGERRQRRSQTLHEE